MDKKKIGLFYVLIPFFTTIFLSLCFILACFLEFPTNRGAIYSAFAILSIMGFLVLPIPSCVLSIIGICKSKNSQKKYKIWTYILGGINILVAVLLIYLWLYVIFVTGPSV